MKILILIFVLMSGCVSSVKKQELEIVKPIIEKKAINKDIAFFTFDAACWLRGENSNKIQFIEEFTIESASSDFIGIKQKDLSTILPPTCFFEAKEKTIEVPYKTDVLDFQCFLDEDLVGGESYNFVENLSSSLIWLVSLKDGQNVIIPKNLCLIYPQSK